MIISREGFVVTINFDQPWERETLAWILQTYGPMFLRRHILKLLADKQKAKKFIQISQELDSDGSNGGASPAVAWAQRTRDSGIPDSITELDGASRNPQDSNSGSGKPEPNPTVSEGSGKGD